jgi:hypothetical protein
MPPPSIRLAPSQIALSSCSRVFGDAAAKVPTHGAKEMIAVAMGGVDRRQILSARHNPIRQGARLLDSNRGVDQDRFGAGLQPPDKVKHSLVDLLGSLLLGPMTATWQQESSPKLRYKLRQVGDDLVHPRKG